MVRARPFGKHASVSGRVAVTAPLRLGRIVAGVPKTAPSSEPFAAPQTPRRPSPLDAARPAPPLVVRKGLTLPCAAPLPRVHRAQVAAAAPLPPA